MICVRPGRTSDIAGVFEIVNAAAVAYKGIIPADRWHEPYMARAELESEIADGVDFRVARQDGCLVGVMGIQDRGDVALVRHAYTSPAFQGRGVGTTLLRRVHRNRHRGERHDRSGTPRCVIDHRPPAEEPAMTIHLDHLLVPSRDKVAGAKLLAELLGVPWSPSGVGPFSPVFVNEGLTFDFDEWADPLPLIHYCFRVSQHEFDAILARIEAANIPYRSNVHGPVDHRVNTDHGGSIVYWNEPDGHQWEMLTVSYARRP